MTRILTVAGALALAVAVSACSATQVKQTASYVALAAPEAALVAGMVGASPAVVQEVSAASADANAAALAVLSAPAGSTVQYQAIVAFNAALAAYVASKGQPVAQ